MDLSEANELCNDVEWRSPCSDLKLTLLIMI